MDVPHQRLHPQPLPHPLPAHTPYFPSSSPKRQNHNTPFLANSTFLAASPALYPPLLTQIALPSPNSILSSTAGKAQGQWWGKWTQARVEGQR
ncbi:MAG: hypothetical protein L6R36_007731 [Xanthoria steineri]|nr:MAG: hypothetical protein L6R36_007731 [Xanthoria steineri]